MTSSNISRTVDRRRQHAATAALAASADDAVNVNDGTNEELRERLLGVEQLPAIVRERLIALRPFSSKADMLQRVNHGQPSARLRIGAKLAQKLHVAGAANHQPAGTSPVSSHAPSTAGYPEPACCMAPTSYGRPPAGPSARPATTHISLQARRPMSRGHARLSDMATRRERPYDSAVKCVEKMSFVAILASSAS